MLVPRERVDGGERRFEVQSQGMPTFEGREVRKDLSRELRRSSQ